MFYRKVLVSFLALLLVSVFSSPVFSGEQGHLPPIIQFVLDEPSRLEQTLAAYKNPNSSHIFIAAHRGGKEFDIVDMAPGNSLANIDNLASKGFDLYESDIEILGDGNLVVFHDNIFDDLTNTAVVDDTLDAAILAYAKSLFLTYSDGSVSIQKIPTLEEFLRALKGRAMVKFDLKSGTFGNSTLIDIMQTVVSTGTTEQVLIRGGANLLTIAEANGFDAGMIMRRFSPAPTVAEINDLADNYAVRAISIPAGASAAVIAAANVKGLVVEVHESQNVSDAQRVLDWQAAIDNGVRQFHSFKPSLLKAYLDAQGYREF